MSLLSECLYQRLDINTAFLVTVVVHKGSESLMNINACINGNIYVYLRLIYVVLLRLLAITYLASLNSI